MTIAFDAVSNATPGGGNLTWTHTPVGTPRGVIVFVMQYNNGTDQVTGITYGGVAMDESTASALLKTSTEAMAVYAYHLGSGIPTGPKSVVVSVNATGSIKSAVCYTMTGSANTVIQEADGTINSNSVANPSTTLALDGRNAFCAIGFVSGQQTVGGTTPRSGWTSSYEYDAGNEILGAYRYNTIGSADVTAGWTQTADDALAIAIAIREVYVSLVLDPASLTGTPIPIADVIAPVAQTTVVLRTAALWFSSSRRREIDVNPAQITATPIPLTVDAPITIALDTAVITGTGIGLDVVPGAISTTLDPAVLTATGISLEVDAPVTRTLDTAALAGTGISITVTSLYPSTTVVLSTAVLTATGIALDVVPGEAVLTLDTASLTATGITTSIVRGLFVSLSSAYLATAMPTLGVDAPVTRIMDAAAITATGIGLVVIEQQFVSLSTATLTATGIAVTITALGNVLLDASALTATGIPLSVDAPVTRVLDPAALTATGIPLVVKTGATIALDTASLTATGVNLPHVVQVFVALDAAVLTAAGIGLLPVTFLSILRFTMQRRSAAGSVGARGTLTMGRRSAGTSVENTGVTV